MSLLFKCCMSCGFITSIIPLTQEIHRPRRFWFPCQKFAIKCLAFHVFPGRSKTSRKNVADNKCYSTNQPCFFASRSIKLFAMWYARIINRKSTMYRFNTNFAFLTVRPWQCTVLYPDAATQRVQNTPSVRFLFSSGCLYCSNLHSECSSQASVWVFSTRSVYINARRTETQMFSCSGCISQLGKNVRIGMSLFAPKDALQGSCNPGKT